VPQGCLWQNKNCITVFFDLLVFAEKNSNYFLFLGGSGMLIRMVLAIKEAALQRHLEQRFSHADIQVECLGRVRSTWHKVVQSCGDIIVISEELIPRPVDSGILMLNNLPENPTTVVLHHTDSAEEHAQIMAAGADVVLYSGISWKNLAEAMESILESRRQFRILDQFDRKRRVQPKLSDFGSTSEGMQMFMNQVEQVASSDSMLLLLGETGVGKEHLAKAIHSESARSAGPFVAVNTAALPEQLLESELFGHTRGAFTGATRSRRGAFEQAHGGTIFLDEIGEMPLHLQSKLLRVLQDFEIRPVGGEKPIWVDVRVVTATNRDLEDEVAHGNFRKDLYYRLSVVTLTIPPLRYHREDIPNLARRYINYYLHKIGCDVSRISEPAMQALCSYDWPGNVRELMNVVERSMLLCRTDEISLEDLPDSFRRGTSPEGRLLPAGADDLLSWKGKSLPEIQSEMMDKVERLYIAMVLKEANGRVAVAAGLAGIHSRGLYNKMKRLGLRKEDFRK